MTHHDGHHDHDHDSATNHDHDDATAEHGEPTMGATQGIDPDMGADPASPEAHDTTSGGADSFTERHGEFGGGGSDEGDELHDGTRRHDG